MIFILIIITLIIFIAYCNITIKNNKRKISNIEKIGKERISKNDTPQRYHYIVDDEKRYELERARRAHKNRLLRIKSNLSTFYPMSTFYQNDYMYFRRKRYNN